MSSRPSSTSCRTLLDSLAGLHRITRRGGWIADEGCSAAAAALLALIDELGTVRARELAAQLDIDDSAVSRRLHALDAAGLIERVCDPSDRRAQLVRITDGGRARLDERRTTASVELGTRLAGWHDGEVLALAELLRRLDDSLASPARASARP